MDALAYPATRYAPPAIAHLASKAERERLSPSAVKAFFNIVKHWRLRDEDARELLGGESNGPYYNLKRAAKGSRMPARTLDADTLLRISYLIGIFKHSTSSMAVHWLTTGSLFPIPTRSSEGRRRSSTWSKAASPLCRSFVDCSIRDEQAHSTFLPTHVMGQP